MSRRGNCHDNAPAESFFASLKSDLVRATASRRTPRRARALFDYIETFYNRRRRHSSLGYLTPDEYERQHHANRPELLAA